MKTMFIIRKIGSVIAILFVFFTLTIGITFHDLILNTMINHPGDRFLVFTMMILLLIGLIIIFFVELIQLFKTKDAYMKSYRENIEHYIRFHENEISRLKSLLEKNK